MPAIRLPAEALAADVDTEGLAMSVRLTPHQITQLWRGETIDASDAPIRKLAASLGCEVKTLLVGANDTAANNDCDEVYDDGPAVMFEQPSGGTSKATNREPVDPAALIVDALDALVELSDGYYTTDDAELVADVLSAGEMPSGLTRLEVPAFLRAWLDAAVELRRVGKSSPEAILARVIADAPKGPAKMASGIKAKVEQSKAPPKGTSKKTAKG